TTSASGAPRAATRATRRARTPVRCSPKGRRSAGGRKTRAIKSDVIPRPPRGPGWLPGRALTRMARMGSSEVAERLRELGAYLRFAGDSPWKAKAYDTAAGAVEAPGIGDSLAAVITELAQTGTSPRLEKLRADFPPGLLELTNLPGLRLPRI